jgi:molecular chaperone DnaJ
MAKRDYYEVLGVSRKADPEEIKRAFRTHARKLHPDNKASGDEAAFKELAEAYEILSDSQKRHLYDRYGHEGVKGSAHRFDDIDFSSFAGFGIDDLIDAFFGGGLRSSMRRGGPEQGAHLKYDLQIEFLEAVFGVEKKLNIKRLEECTVCSGTGAAPGSDVATCATCAGAGQVQQVVNSWFGQSIRVMECPTCQGDGRKIDKPCRECRGQGLLKKAHEFALPVPAGIDHGARLRVGAKGDKGKRGGPFGDLFVVIHVEEHKQFVRDGDTIHVSQPISFSMAALGGELMVPSVDGEKLVKIAPGTQTGATVILKELGVPRLGNPNRRGDQIVHLVVRTPTKITSEERELLEKLAQLRGETLNVPKKEGEEPSRQSKLISDNNGDKSGASGSVEKDDPSFIERIVDAFRPKSGEHEIK